MGDFKITTGKALLDMKQALHINLLEPYFPKTGLVCIAGGSDVGKSTFSRQLCVSIVTGKEDFIGLNLHPTRKKAMYLSTEDTLLNLKGVLEKQVSDADKTAMDNFLFIDINGDTHKELGKALKTNPVDVVVIDVWTDTYSGSMNEANKVRDNLKEYVALAEQYKTLFILIHHMGKRTEFLDPDKNNLLGSQAIEATCRTVLELRADRNNPKLRYLSVLKGNYISHAVKQVTLKLEFTDDLLFVNTGTTVDKKKLSGVATRKFGSTPELKQKVIQFHLAGKSIRDIETEMANLYDTAPKRQTIANWINEYKESQNEHGEAEQEVADSNSTPPQAGEVTEDKSDNDQPEKDKPDEEQEPPQEESKT